METIHKFWSGTFPYVFLFGIFVASSLMLQCFIPFLQRMAEIHDGSWEWLLTIFNSKFILPMEMISNFWAGISATYVGLDRAAFTVDAFKNGIHNDAFDDGKLKSLRQIMLLSFIIYGLAVILNTFFDAELALTPLFISFGSSVLCYVAGNKTVIAFSKLTPEDELEENDIKLEELNENQIKTLAKISKLLIEDKKEMIIKIDENDRIVGMNVK